jgi:uncharacterized protein DUF3386
MRSAALVTGDVDTPAAHAISPAACLDASAAPAAASAPADDRAARGLLCRAQGHFQKWPEVFAGFRARVACETPRGHATAQVCVTPPGSVEVGCSDGVLRQRVFDMLWGVALDRTPRFFGEGDGRFPVTFGDDSPAEDGATGRPIDVHAPSGRVRYWLDGRARVRRIERTAGGLRLVTVFDGFTRTTPGRVLPCQISTRTWDVASGELLSQHLVEDTHCRLEHVWLPAARRVRMESGGASLVLTLHDHELI